MGSFGSRFEVAVFPLTNAVLFPGVTLPLQVFEERYEKMLSDIRIRSMPLAVCLVIPQSNQEFLMNPICGAGEVQLFQQYPDGHSDILVHGNQRVRLEGVIRNEPYLLMEAERLENPTVIESHLKWSLDELKTLIQTWIFFHPDLPDYMSMIFDGFKGYGELTDFFVFHFMKKVEDQQRYLDCPNPLERAEWLARYLEVDLLRLSRRHKREKKFMMFH